MHIYVNLVKDFGAVSKDINIKNASIVFDSCMEQNYSLKLLMSSGDKRFECCRIKPIQIEYIQANILP